MGVYLYMAKKSKPISALFQGKKVQIHRYEFISRACSLDDVPSGLQKIVGCIDHAWNGNVPELGVCAKSAEDVRFSLVEAPDSIYWYDCDALGKSIGYLTRNLADKLILIPAQEFELIIQKVTGYASSNELLRSKADIVLDPATEAGKIITAFCKSYCYTGRVVTPIDLEAENYMG